MISTCVCIPTYNNPGTIRSVVESCLRETPYVVIVVDDGSQQPVEHLLAPLQERAAAGEARLYILRLHQNTGKGNALMVAFRFAASLRFTNAVACDADGQHFPQDIPRLVEAGERGKALVIGCREMGPENSPWISRFGRSVSNSAVWCATGARPGDSQSGMRYYPIEPLLRLRLTSGRFEFELEVLLKLLWAGVSLRQVPIRVYYPESGRVSHFHKVRDNLRISLLYLRLIADRLFSVRGA